MPGNIHSTVIVWIMDEYCGFILFYFVFVSIAHCHMLLPCFCCHIFLLVVYFLLLCFLLSDIKLQVARASLVVSHVATNFPVLHSRHKPQR